MVNCIAHQRASTGVQGVTNGGSYNNKNVCINQNLQTSILLLHANGYGLPGDEKYPIGFAVSHSFVYSRVELQSYINVLVKVLENVEGSEA